MKIRKSQKISDTIAKRLKAAHRWTYLPCKECNKDVKVDEQAKAVICAVCSSKKVSAPEAKKKVEKSERPAGWRFMSEFVDSDGTVYFHGEEQPELKGKKPISDVKKIKSEQKAKRLESKKKKEFRDKLKNEKLVKEYKTKKEVKKKFEEEKTRELEDKLKETVVDTKTKKPKKVKSKKLKKSVKIKTNKFFN